MRISSSAQHALGVGAFIAILAGCDSSANVTPAQSVAPSNVRSSTAPLVRGRGSVQYSVINLGTLGGTLSGGTSINNEGMIGGVSLFH
jgi:hypothetical protein